MEKQHSTHAKHVSRRAAMVTVGVLGMSEKLNATIVVVYFLVRGGKDRQAVKDPKIE
jgi:hypothetical protein